MLVKFSSRWNTESMNSFTLFSAAATCACRKRRLFPICAARRSVGVGEEDFFGSSVKSEEGMFFCELDGAAS